MYYRQYSIDTIRSIYSNRRIEQTIIRLDTRLLLEWFAIEDVEGEAADGERALGVSTSVTIRLEDDTLHRKRLHAQEGSEHDVEELDGDDKLTN